MRLIGMQENLRHDQTSGQGLKQRPAAGYPAAIVLFQIAGLVFVPGIDLRVNQLPRYGRVIQFGKKLRQRPQLVILDPGLINAQQLRIAKILGHRQTQQPRHKQQRDQGAGKK